MQGSVAKDPAPLPGKNRPLTDAEAASLPRQQTSAELQARIAKQQQLRQERDESRTRRLQAKAQGRNPGSFGLRRDGWGPQPAGPVAQLYPAPNGNGPAVQYGRGNPNPPYGVVLSIGRLF